MNFHVAVIKIVKELALKLRVFLVAKLKISRGNKKNHENHMMSIPAN